MKLLAFDTSTDQMSIAVSRGEGASLQVWQHEGAGGAQASLGLIAGVLNLLAQAQLRVTELDAICFGSGPGSFTGLRTACAVAQGLAFGADVPVLPVQSLLALAETARHAALAGLPRVRVLALLDARMDEIYGGLFAFADGQWTERSGAALYAPERVPGVHATEPDLQLVGNVFSVYAGRLDLPVGVPCITALPTASALLRLAPQLLAQGQGVPAAQALPTYVRDKVAQTSAERAAIKAAVAAAR